MFIPTHKTISTNKVISVHEDNFQDQFQILIILQIFNDVK